MKKTLIAIAVIAASAFADSAQQYQFGSPTYLTVATNSASINGQNVFSVTNLVQVQPGPISLTITATNAATVVTNTLTTVITATNITTFIYSAATYGVNFSTNFPSTTFTATAVTTAWAIPQSGGSNTCYIK